MAEAHLASRPTISDQMSVVQTSDTMQTLADAYECIGLQDTSLSDEDVVAAFYQAYSRQRDTSNGGTSRPLKSLNLIADCRQSQLLAVTLQIAPHLPKASVSIPDTKPTSAGTTETWTSSKINQSPGEHSNQETGSSNNTAHDLTKFESTVRIEQLAKEHSNHETENSNDTAHDPPKPFIFGGPATIGPAKDHPTATIDISETDAGINPDRIDDASNFSEGALSWHPSSSDDDSNTSEISEPVGGKIWDGQIWCCKVCGKELEEEGTCFEDHTINPCRYCGKDFIPYTCSVFCIECHSELPDLCSVCNIEENSDDNDSSEDIQMIWDDNDNVWRCTTCSWEVEANSENEGQCHCRVDPEGSSPEESAQSGQYEGRNTTTLVRPIELLYYHEYEPADSDSSGSESVDSEPDSDDERAIDDGELVEPNLSPSVDPPLPPDDTADAVEPTVAGKVDAVATSSEPQCTDIEPQRTDIENAF